MREYAFWIGILIWFFLAVLMAESTIAAWKRRRRLKLLADERIVEEIRQRFRDRSPGRTGEIRYDTRTQEFKYKYKDGTWKSV